MRLVAILVLGMLLLLTGLSSVYTVDQAEFAYITQFGRPVRTWEGARDAGLHVKWPWPVQSIQRIDRRLQMFDLPSAELPTFDPMGQTLDKMLIVDGYVCWQIRDEDDLDRFIRTVGTPERAREILGPMIAGRVGSVISQMRLEDLIQVSPPQGRAADINARMGAFQQKLLAEGEEDDLRRLLRDQFGIHLIDVRLRRLSYPDSVRQSIFERIKSERRRKAAEYESDGDKQARDIRSAAERDAEITRATAQAEAELIRRRADAEADRIRNEAHAQDPDFYVFLQTIETYKQMMGKSNDVLLLSSKHPLFQLLLNPPSPPTKK